MMKFRILSFNSNNDKFLVRTITDNNNNSTFVFNDCLQFSDKFNDGYISENEFTKFLVCKEKFPIKNFTSIKIEKLTIKDYFNFNYLLNHFKFKYNKKTNTFIKQKE